MSIGNARVRRWVGGVAVAAGLAVAAVFGAVGTAVADGGVQTVSGSESGPGGFAYATCPKGTRLIGGGYWWWSEYTSGTPQKDMVEANHAFPGRHGVWEVKPHLGHAKAFALCRNRH